MKTITAWTLILWLALVLEQTRPDTIQTTSVVFPFAIACIFWQRSGISILMAGAALVLRWALSPSAIPLDVGSILLLSAWFLTRSPRTMTQSVHKSGRHPFWLDPFLVLLIGTACHSSPAWLISPNAFLESLIARLVISVPCLLVVSLIMRFSDELGLRRDLKTI